MKLSYKYIALLFLLMAGLVSCRQDEPTRSMSLELTLCLPAQEMSYHAPARRTIGDPGTSEVLALPKYAYIFVTKEEGGVKDIWQKKEIKMDAGNWEKLRYNGQFATEGDYIYRYNQREVFLLSNTTPKGKIYVICSNKKLTLTPTFASISTVDDIMNLKFNTAPDSIQENLQNIYSTPYNYIKDGDYYCTYDCSEGNVYTLDLLLYHVASKVDLKWNVEENKRIDKITPSNGVRLTYMEARRLFNGQAYCFKPMKNEVATLPSSGYDIENIVTAADEGLWWEGRSYFYTIPYYVAGEPDYFPLQMVMCTNGVNKAYGYQLTLKQPMDTSDVFVPWLRGIFNLTQPLENKSETKTIDG
ncbi:MAG: hypothetical protein IJS57_05005 [Paludibacteraceae bacterium]|nr:hypothetical protein [Paludibacteraceae bacterium]